MGIQLGEVTAHNGHRPPDFIFCRYPAILVRFHLNEHTGGEGLFKGGDGVVREMLFRRPLTLSILTERRVYSPYGLEGRDIIILFPSVFLSPLF